MTDDPSAAAHDVEPTAMMSPEAMDSLPAQPDLPVHVDADARSLVPIRALADVVDVVRLVGWAGPWPITPVVADSGMLINSVFRGVRWEEDVLFLTAARSGFIRVFVPDDVYGEMERHLASGSRWCRKRRIDDVEPFRTRWDREYAPVIRSVAIAAADVADPRVAAVNARDPNDGAFAALASLLAPCIALAEDRDITDHALATREWEPLAVLAGSTATSGERFVAAMFGGNLTVHLTVATLRGLFQSRWWPLVLAAAAGSLLYAHSREPITRESLTKAWNAAMRVLEPLIQYLEDGARSGDITHKHLDAAAISPQPGLPPRLHLIARAVAISPRAATATEVASRLTPLCQDQVRHQGQPLLVELEG